MTYSNSVYEYCILHHYQTYTCEMLWHFNFSIYKSCKSITYWNLNGQYSLHQKESIHPCRAKYYANSVEVNFYTFRELCTWLCSKCIGGDCISQKPSLDINPNHYSDLLTKDLEQVLWKSA